MNCVIFLLETLKKVGLLQLEKANSMIVVNDFVCL